MLVYLDKCIRCITDHAYVNGKVPNIFCVEKSGHITNTDIVVSSPAIMNDKSILSQIVIISIAKEMQNYDYAISLIDNGRNIQASDRELAKLPCANMS